MVSTPLEEVSALLMGLFKEKTKQIKDLSFFRLMLMENIKSANYSIKKKHGKRPNLYCINVVNSPYMHTKGTRTDFPDQLK